MQRKKLKLNELSDAQLEVLEKDSLSPSDETLPIIIAILENLDISDRELSIVEWSYSKGAKVQEQLRILDQSEFEDINFAYLYEERKNPKSDIVLKNFHAILQTLSHAAGQELKNRYQTKKEVWHDIKLPKRPIKSYIDAHKTIGILYDTITENEKYKKLGEEDKNIIMSHYLTQLEKNKEIKTHPKRKYLEAAINNHKLIQANPELKLEEKFNTNPELINMISRINRLIIYYKNKGNASVSVKMRNFLNNLLENLTENSKFLENPQNRKIFIHRLKEISIEHTDTKNLKSLPRMFYQSKIEKERKKIKKDFVSKTETKKLK